MSDDDLEREIVAKGLTAPRIEKKQIDALLADLNYHVHVVPGTTTTVATAFLSNGFTVAIGQSACVSPENFDKALGAKVAMDNAKSKAADQLWTMEGWRLKRQLETLDAIAEWCDRHGIDLKGSEELEAIVFGVEV